MQYYKRHLGDYAKKAGRLSMLQHGAYTLLLDACYDRERFPTEGEAIEWTWASTPEEEQAVKFVLTRFFELQEDGTYVQPRVADELQAYKVNEVVNRLIAIAREAKKKNNLGLANACDQLRDEIKHAPLSKTHEAWTELLERVQKEHEPPPNHKPLTTNHKPLTNSSSGSADASPESTKNKNTNFTVATLVNEYHVDRQVAQDWLAVRAKKRLPNTQTALNKLINEFSKAGLSVPDGVRKCAENGWAGFRDSFQWGDKHENSKRTGGNSKTGHQPTITEQDLRDCGIGDGAQH